MVGFRETWQKVYDMLSSSASQLGCEASSITKGAPGQSMPLSPPFVYVFCLPGEGAHENASGQVGSAYAEFTIFCGVPPSENAEDSIADAVELAGRVRTVLVGSDLVSDIDSPVFEAIGADFTLVTISFRMMYDPFEELL